MLIRKLRCDCLLVKQGKLTAATVTEFYEEIFTNCPNFGVVIDCGEGAISNFYMYCSFLY